MERPGHRSHFKNKRGIAKMLINCFLYIIVVYPARSAPNQNIWQRNCNILFKYLYKRKKYLDIIIEKVCKTNGLNNKTNEMNILHSLSSYYYRSAGLIFF
jgi:hypothetical protein